jgi:hypothetical protein
MGLLFKKSKQDRRDCEYRRESPYNLDYFLKGGRERRNGQKDRRLTPDRGVDWWGNRTHVTAKNLDFS